MVLNNLFDKIIVISLPDRQDRLQKCLLEVSSHGININHPNFEVFPAIKKDEGAEGLFYTMLAIFEKCHDAEYKKVLILEDDAKFLSGLQILTLCIQFLDNIKGSSWDLLHLGPNTHETFKKWETRYLLPVQNGLATHAVIYSQQCIKKVIEMDLVWEGKPIDIILAEEIQKHGYSYCTYPILATQQEGWSDIEKLNVNYNHVENKFYKNVTGILNE